MYTYPRMGLGIDGSVSVVFLQTLHAHAQFCISGDHTLEATKDAIKKLADEEADEHFVIVLSDANLDRYGIRPQRFAEILTSDEKVNAYVIFIGSLGNQATRYTPCLSSIFNSLNSLHVHKGSSGDTVDSN